MRQRPTGQRSSSRRSRRSEGGPAYLDVGPRRLAAGGGCAFVHRSNPGLPPDRARRRTLLTRSPRGLRRKEAAWASRAPRGGAGWWRAFVEGGRRPRHVRPRLLRPVVGPGARRRAGYEVGEDGRRARLAWRSSRRCDVVREGRADSGGPAAQRPGAGARGGASQVAVRGTLHDPAIRQRFHSPPWRRRHPARRAARARDRVPRGPTGGVSVRASPRVREKPPRAPLSGATWPRRLRPRLGPAGPTRSSCWPRSSYVGGQPTCRWLAGRGHRARGEENRVRRATCSPKGKSGSRRRPLHTWDFIGPPCKSRKAARTPVGRVRLVHLALHALGGRAARIAAARQPDRVSRRGQQPARRGIQAGLGARPSSTRSSRHSPGIGQHPCRGPHGRCPPLAATAGGVPGRTFATLRELGP